MFSQTLGSQAQSGFTYPYELSQSAMFDSASSSYTARNEGEEVGDTNNTTKVFSLWAKRSTLDGADQTLIGGYFSSNLWYELTFDLNNKLEFACVTSGTYKVRYISTQVFRDCSAWYHIFVRLDTTESTEADRVQIYVNGSEVTAWATQTEPTASQAVCYQSYNSGGGFSNVVGGLTSSANLFDGYLAEVYVIDGTAYDVTDFGQFQSGIWVPKSPPSLTYGNHGFHLDFSDSSSFGDDTSGNTNDYTDNNMGTDHQVSDSPTNNYCVLDFNNKYTTPTAFTEGGLYMNHTPTGYVTACGTFLLPTSGKWYWEVDISPSDTATMMAGIVKAGERSGDLITSSYYIGQDTDGVSIQSNGSAWYLTYNAGFTIDDNLAVPANNDIIQVAVDCDAGYIWFGVNNTWGDFGATGVGDPAGGSNPAKSGLDFTADDYVPAITCYATDLGPLNFGQRTFTYTPPTGFNTLCTNNLSEPSILEPKDVVDVVQYTGDGVEVSVSTLNFQPDFVWNRSDGNGTTVDYTPVFDSLRGATKYNVLNVNQGETTDANTLTSFDSAGFTVGSAGLTNTSGDVYTSKCFKKGAAYGIDIQTYLGTGSAHAESHDLGAVPEMIWVNDLDDASSRNWRVYHHNALNKTDPETDAYSGWDNATAWADGASYWNDTAPTSTQFTVGTHVGVNNSGVNYIAYLFRSIDGLIKVGSYEGNGNANGPYVYCGFRPALILVKNADGANAPVTYDYSNDTYNPVDYETRVDVNDGIATTTYGDFTANGFKVRSTSTRHNITNNTYTYIAWAEQPFKYANAR